MPKRAELRKMERKDGRKSPWGISIPQKGSRAKREFFSTKRERDAEFDRLKRIDRQEGRGALTMSAGDAQLLNDIREILPEGTDPREAARFFVEQQCPKSTVPLKEAVRGFLRRQQFRGLNQSYYQHIELALGRLTAAVGDDVLVSEISLDQITVILMGLPFEPITVHHYKNHLSTFFNWCVEQRYCSHSPMIGIGKIEIPESEPEFMPVDHVKAFFKTAEELYPHLTPALALSFFAGVRSLSIERMERSDLDFEQRGIRFQGAQHKTKRRFFVQGHEPNLWKWLEPWKDLKTLPSWPNSTFIKHRAKIYQEARVPFPKNAGRHSFCTYHVALNGSADKTATLLTHRGSISVMYDHYRGNTTQEAAKEYFRI